MQNDMDKQRTCADLINILSHEIQLVIATGIQDDVYVSIFFCLIETLYIYSKSLHGQNKAQMWLTYKLLYVVACLCQKQKYADWALFLPEGTKKVMLCCKIIVSHPSLTPLEMPKNIATLLCYQTPLVK